MKTVIKSLLASVMFCGFPILANAQTDNIPCIKESDGENVQIAQNFSNNQSIDTLILKDGSKLKVGDTLIFGTPFNNRKEYQHIIFGKFTLAKALMMTPTYMPDNWHGSKVVITEIYLTHSKMSKISPVTFHCFVADYTQPGISCNRSIFYISEAINKGEIINPNAAMTREQAIAKLKESKDLLDLGLLSQEEYNRIKSELTPIIMGQN